MAIYLIASTKRLVSYDSVVKKWEVYEPVEGPPTTPTDNEISALFNFIRKNPDGGIIELEE